MDESNHLPCEDPRECAKSLLASFTAELENMDADDNVILFNEEAVQIVTAIRDELDVWLEMHEPGLGDLGEEPN